MIEGESQKLEHLLRRTTFGVRTSEYAYWAELGPNKAVDALLNYEQIPENISPLSKDSSGALVPVQDTDALRRYWLLRFFETSRPFEETMTLFWHGHFATSDYKVQNPNYMWRQNEFLRKNALGSFRDLLRGVAVDPAMLIWLDGRTNKQRHPNENFSRELLELFALGVDGGYTEKDVKEGARALTGWSFDDDQMKLKFELQDHDMAVKDYLGKRGNWTLDQAIDIVANHPSTAKFISKKLFTFFVHEDPSPQELDRLSKVYFASKFSIRELVRAVLTSPDFYSDKAAYALIKSPIQYTTLMVKTLDVPFRHLYDVKDQMDRMGQSLLDPPNVKGWKGGEAWVNANTMTVRMNYANRIVNEIRYRGLMKSRVTKALAARGVNADLAFGSPESAVQALWDWIMPGMTIPDHLKGPLLTYMKDRAPKNATKNHYWDRASSAIELIFTSPEYQLA